MEHIDQQKGAFQAPVIEQTHFDQPATVVSTAGTVALAGEVASAPAPAARHGYREDSPPEILDLLHRAQSGETEAFAGIYQAHVWPRDALCRVPAA